MLGNLFTVLILINSFGVSHLFAHWILLQVKLFSRRDDGEKNFYQLASTLLTQDFKGSAFYAFYACWWCFFPAVAHCHVGALRLLPRCDLHISSRDLHVWQCLFCSNLVSYPTPRLTAGPPTAENKSTTDRTHRISSKMHAKNSCVSYRSFRVTVFGATGRS